MTTTATHTSIVIQKTLIICLISLAWLVSVSPAEAKILVEGDREFTDDINSCLNTYRDTPGLVGEVIKELENSTHDHTIIESPDWSNAPNDIAKATGGSGSGSVTRVDKAELEKYKNDFPELKDKDFCTALLHELWHAVDNNRGTRTAHSEKVDGVKRNEIEATIFQNFVHALRGVPPRTMYGGVDMSKILSTSEISPASPKDKTSQESTTTATAQLNFKHVQPGVYSEIYVTITTTPKTALSVTLSGPGVDSAPTQIGTTGDTGLAKFTWRIVSYGQYVLAGILSDTGENFSGTINVQ